MEVYIFHIRSRYRRIHLDKYYSKDCPLDNVGKIQVNILDTQLLYTINNSDNKSSKTSPHLEYQNYLYKGNHLK